MTENEAVEKMARAIFAATAIAPQARRWDDLYPEERERWCRCARLALTSHPAVEVLRDCVRNAEEYGAMSPSLTQRARTVLASLPKEK